MRRKAELKNIAGGLVGSFSSRNNDVNGYWGIGKLYKFAESCNVNVITIDLKNGLINPNTQEFDTLIGEYQTKLQSRLSARRISDTCVDSSLFRAYFNCDVGEKLFEWGNGDPYEICCEIVDSLGRVQEARAKGYCKPHDPTRESKRAI